MRRAFLSYRRDDTQFITGFLHRELEHPDAFGPASVFMDIDNVPPGVGFRKVIQRHVSQCEFFLTVSRPPVGVPEPADPRPAARLALDSPSHPIPSTRHVSS